MQGASARRRNSTLGNLLTQHLFFKININALRNGPRRMSKDALRNATVQIAVATPGQRATIAEGIAKLGLFDISSG